MRASRSLHKARTPRGSERSLKQADKLSVTNHLQLPGTPVCGEKRYNDCSADKACPDAPGSGITGHGLRNNPLIEFSAFGARRHSARAGLCYELSRNFILPPSNF
jgi:uncharacterized protein YbbK (DUF523 family)